MKKTLRNKIIAGSLLVGALGLGGCEALYREIAPITKLAPEWAQPAGVKEYERKRRGSIYTTNVVNMDTGQNIEIVGWDPSGYLDSQIEKFPKHGFALEYKTGDKISSRAYMLNLSQQEGVRILKFIELDSEADMRNLYREIEKKF